MEAVTNSRHNSLIDSAKYYGKCALASAKVGIIKSFAPATFALTSLVSMAILFPEYTYSDPDYEDFEETFILDNEEEIDKALSLYEKKGIKISEEIPPKWEENIISKIMTSLKAAILEYKKIVEDINTDLNISAKFALTFQQYRGLYCPASAAGGTISFQNPLVEYQVPFCEIEIETVDGFKEEPTLNWLTETNRLNTERRKFLMAHEFMHVLNNDSLTNYTWTLITSLISTIPWITGYGNSSSWSNYLISSLIKSFFIESISDFALKFLSRMCEKRADLQALDYLQTNEGAIEHFKGFEDIPDEGDFEHPPRKERIKYLKEWRK